MFLFRSSQDSSSVSSPSAVTAGVDGVKSAIKKASDATGAGFSYLLRTAEKESSLKPDAQAPTSSAKGLYQFIDQTWLSVLKDEGPRYGLSSYSDAISKSSDGRLAVNDPSMRDTILNLRNDPHVSSLMAGAFTNRNANDLKSTIGRDPTEGELYMAHFLGSNGASRLISLARDTPSASAANAFPDAADANRRIFYDKAGSARSVGEVYQLLSRGQDQAANVPAAATSSSGATPNSAQQAIEQTWSAVPQAHPAANKPFHSLFSDTNTGNTSNTARAGVSPFVNATWAGVGQTQAPQAGTANAAASGAVQANSVGGPFQSLTSPGWVRTVQGVSGIGSPLELASFRQNGR
jgi:hypothetical protein